MKKGHNNRRDRDNRQTKVGSQNSSEPWTGAGTLGRGTGLPGARFKFRSAQDGVDSYL